MTIKELDDKLNSPGFQDTENGDLFYNFFIYQYPAEKEYDIVSRYRSSNKTLSVLRIMWMCSRSTCLKSS